MEPYFAALHVLDLTPDDVPSLRAVQAFWPKLDAVERMNFQYRYNGQPQVLTAVGLKPIDIATTLKVGQGTVFPLATVAVFPLTEELVRKLKAKFIGNEVGDDQYLVSYVSLHGSSFVSTGGFGVKEPDTLKFTGEPTYELLSYSRLKVSGITHLIKATTPSGRWVYATSTLGRGASSSKVILAGKFFRRFELIEGALDRHDIDLLEAQINDRPDYPVLEAYTHRNPTIASYKMHYDEVINNGLRKQQVSALAQEIVSEIVRQLDATPPSTVTLYRGVKSTSQKHVGDIIEDRGFMSKAINYDVAESFSDENPCCIYIMRYPEPSHQLNPASERNESEAELISYPGERFEIKAILRDTTRVGLPYQCKVHESSNERCISQGKTVYLMDYVGNMYGGNFNLAARTGLDPYLDQLKALDLPYTKKLVYKTRNGYYVEADGVSGLIRDIVNTNRVTDVYLMDRLPDTIWIVETDRDGTTREITAANGNAASIFDPIVASYKFYTKGFLGPRETQYTVKLEPVLSIPRFDPVKDTIDDALTATMISMIDAFTRQLYPQYVAEGGVNSESDREAYVKKVISGIGNTERYADFSKYVNAHKQAFLDTVYDTTRRQFAGQQEILARMDDPEFHRVKMAEWGEF